MAASYNVNTDLVRGNDLMIYYKPTSGTTVPIAFAKSVDLSISADSIDTSNKMSGKFKSNLQGQISYTVNSDFLYTQATGDTSFDTMLSVMLTGGTVEFVIGTTTDSTTFSLTKGLYTGTASIASLSLKAEDNGIASCSISMNGSGALSKVVV